MPQGDVKQVDVFAEYDRLKIENTRMEVALKEIQSLVQNKSAWVRQFNNQDLITIMQLFGNAARRGLFGV